MSKEDFIKRAVHIGKKTGRIPEHLYYDGCSIAIDSILSKKGKDAINAILLLRSHY